MKQVVAAFDFDGTITYFDSLLPFLVYSMGGLGAIFKLALVLPKIPGIIRDKGRAEAKSYLLSHCLSHLSETQLQRVANEFSANRLDAIVRKKALDRIRWHRERGHYCVVISASIDLYLQPWCERHGLDALICTRFDINTRQLNGPNCKGEEKVRRLSELFPDRDSYQLWAYGDSEGDRDLLNFADHSYYRRFPRD